MTMVMNYIVQRRRREKGKWWIGGGAALIGSDLGSRLSELERCAGLLTPRVMGC